MSRYETFVGADDSLGDRARTVRRTVFVEEQGVPESLEMDGKDGAASHVLVTDDGVPVATARVRFPDAATAKIERVAVVPPARGEGLGRRVMAVAETCAADQGATVATLHSQQRVVGFYESLGYAVVGDPFEEAGIPHRSMRKSLS